MKTVVRTVTDVDGVRHPAQFLCCAGCGCDRWFCYIVQGDQHSHFQCVACGVSYCADGTCGKGEPSRERRN